ncbi:alpha-D-ribose 1-methylphosphonate 5-triphosphate diphosphatase [Pseudochelatococcus sp. B33]
MNDLGVISPEMRHAGSTERSAEMVFTNARIVTADEVLRGTVQVLDGIIVDIAGGATAVPGALDLEGDYLLPGLVDVHTDHLEKTSMPRAGMFWHPMNAAMTHDIILAAAGITTVFDSLVVGAVGNPDRRKLLPLMIRGLADARRAGLLRIDHLLHLRCDAREAGLMDVLAPYLDDPLVRFVTILDDSPGRDPARFRRTMLRKKASEEEIAREEADAAVTDELARNNRLALVEACKARALPFASHDDTLVGHIAEAEAFGMTISEFPISIDSARAAGAAGMAIITGSPNIVAGRSHAGNVSGRDLAAEGLVDIVCSDYIPASLLHALWVLTADSIGLGLPKAIAMGTKRPAELFGLSDRGEIAPGLRGDLVRVNERDDTPIIRNVWVAGRQVL